MGRSIRARESSVNISDGRGVPLSAVLCGVLGFALGFAVWILLNIAYKLTDVIWNPFFGRFALVTCACGVPGWRRADWLVAKTFQKCSRAVLVRDGNGAGGGLLFD